MRRSTALALVSLLLATGVAAASFKKERAAVERIRGLTFTAPVTTVEIDRAELPSRLRDQLARGLPYSVDEWATILRALLLIDDDRADPMQDMLELYNAQVLAYYDPATKTFYSVRQLPDALKQLPPGFAPEEAVIVHELTHALQDQRFAIGKRDYALRNDTDANLAYHAFLEGEATLVMLAYTVEKMGAPFDEVVQSPLVTSLLANAANADLSGAPRYFGELLKFPYLSGLQFVLEAYRRGGWKEMDAIHARPPRSTREILHPEEYFNRRFTPPVFSPDTRAVEHLGEFHWAYFVGSDNSVGWMDDRATIAYDDFCRPIVKIETRWQSEEAARRFSDSYVRFLEQKNIGAIASREGTTVRVTYVP